jgi:mevalonate kinase
VGGGLGSSASVTVALTRAISAFLGHPFDNETVNDIAFEIEKLHHGTPSGIDNSVVTYAKPLYFVKGSPIQWLEIEQPLQFLIANSGIKGSTGKAVNIVREKWNSSKKEIDSVFENIGEITKDLFHVLRSGTPLEAGSLLTKNHNLLATLGISLPLLDSLVDTALNTGAYGAKLTGGGLGGNILALVPPEKSDQISIALQNAGAVNVIRTQLNQEKGKNQ